MQTTVTSKCINDALRTTRVNLRDVASQQRTCINIITKNDISLFIDVWINPKQCLSPGNSFRNFGQCERVTSLPPDPQSGCCGREASDDDRITGTLLTVTVLTFSFQHVTKQHLCQLVDTGYKKDNIVYIAM